MPVQHQVSVPMSTTLGGEDEAFRSAGDLRGQSVNYLHRDWNVPDGILRLRSLNLATPHGPTARTSLHSGLDRQPIEQFDRAFRPAEDAFNFSIRVGSHFCF